MSEFLHSLESSLFEGFDFQSGLDHPDPNWIQSCPTSLSPVGDIFAIGIGSKVAVVIKSKHETIGQTFKVFDTGVDAEVSSILTIPLLNSKGANHPVWTCIVIGHTDGLVQIISSDRGEVLFKKKYSEGKVVKVRSSNRVSPAKARAIDSAFIAPTQEILIIFNKLIVAINGPSLHKLLHANRAMLAENLAFGKNGLDEEAFFGLQAKKWVVKDQHISDACVINEPNVSFDQIAQLSISNRINETHLKSIRYLLNFVTVGEDPFIQFCLPYNYQQQDINELAGNVVSTVKSGIFRAASNMIWGSSGSSSKLDSEKDRPEPEQKLTVNFTFKDKLKGGSVVEKSFDDQYIAIVDNQNRVLVLDAFSGVVVQVWKGYHHAQIAWLTANSAGIPNDLQEKLPFESKIACLLAIYLPRRGSLEVVSMEKKTRVAEFSVSKNGRLVQAQGTILDSSGLPSLRRMVDACFLDEKGTIMEIVIPLQCAIDQTSSTQDLMKQQRLLDLLRKSEPDIRETALLICSAKSSAAQISMMLDVLKNKSLDVSHAISMFQEVQKLHDEAESSVESVRKSIDAFQRITEIYGIFNENFTKNVFTSTDGDNFVKNLNINAALKSEITNSDEPFTETNSLTMESLLLWLGVVVEPDGIGISPRSVKMNHAKPIVLAIMASSRMDETKLVSLLRELKIKPEDMFKILLETLTSSNITFLKTCYSCLPFTFSMILNLGEEKLKTFFEASHKMLVESTLELPLYIFSKQWLLSVQEKNENNDIIKSLTSFVSKTESFLMVQKAHDSLRNQRNIDEPLKSFTWKDVYCCGNGKISEIICQWLVDDRITVEALASPELVDFTSRCAEYFPRSVQDSTLWIHLVWEYFHKWNRSRKRVQLMEHAEVFLNHLAKTLENPYIIHKLCLITWRTFLEKVALDSVNVTEVQSTSRCQREIGVAVSDLHRILKVALTVSKLSLDTECSNEGLTEIREQTFYDSISDVKQNHLLDHLFLMNTETSLSEQMALRFQFVLVTCVIQRFGVEMKPLELFSQQETNGFFQGDSNFNVGSLLTFSHSKHLKHRRSRFLRLSCREVAKTIHLLPGNRGLDTDDFRFWSSNLVMLEKMWFEDMVRPCLIVSLYREGFDDVGDELLSGLVNKDEVGEDLLNVAVLRLTKFFYESEDHQKKIVSVKPEILHRFSQMQGEAKELCETSLESTKTLLMVLSSMSLEEESIQLIYECLSLVQLFSRMQK